MDIKEYISSGIIESYVMGLATREERAEFEELCRRFPELVAARESFEADLEKQARLNAIKPDPAIKTKLMASIRESKDTSSRVVRMDTRSNSSLLRWVAVASVILMLGSGYLAWNFYAQNRDYATELAQLKHDREMMGDPNMMVVNLRGTEKAPQSSASIYWDSTSSNVYLVVKNMPKLPNDKQYQLWALIDNQPKDLGLFDVKTDGTIVLKMINTQQADAFAITIEKRGNTGPPDMNAVQVVGNTSL